MKKSSLQFHVREYECDQWGIVNHAVYLNYLEQARFDFCKNILNIDFKELAKQKIYFVVVRVESDFRSSLISGEEIIIETSMERPSKRRFQFTQNIHRFSDSSIVLNAKVTATAINEKNQSEVPDKLEKLLIDFPAPIAST